MISPEAALLAQRAGAREGRGPTDTIYALSSAPGKAGIAVIRASGPAAGAALEALAGGRPPERRASVRRLRHPVSRETLDEAVVLWFPAPGSFTGEDAAELHVHGGRATVMGVLDALAQVSGLRLARPGEFARRAFEGGRLDLAEAEALADLIDAETAAQRRQALGGLDGGLSARAADWRERLVGLMALAEAAIDFPDEDDVPGGLAAEIAVGAGALADEIAAVLDDGGRGERLRTGATIVVAGRPNVGKSTLLNGLAAREVAIVSPHPGTTRDTVEVALDLGGYPATLVDTAGLRDSADPVEAEGVRRARARAAAADLVLWLDDDPAFSDLVRSAKRGESESPVGRPGEGYSTSASPPPAEGSPLTPTLSPRAGSGSSTTSEAGAAPFTSPLAGEVESLAATGGRERALPSPTLPRERKGSSPGAPLWRILTKIDLVPPSSAGVADFAVSCRTGDGIAALVRALTDWLAGSFRVGPEPVVTRARQRDACAVAVAALRRAAAVDLAAEFVAEDLRLAARALGRLAGRVDSEDVLDRVFSAFCIGK
ncbi:MAG TPA: tRNA uridine-5-carboxymethylaminomethyl(34) synthesis GTPase MnmE [Hyphomicrobiales bacterium]|nr:tRNA uridine-5-carboxymethylaminomethyl(34) synthesis GTPase MnmE [Hyphomicrobiales bacterium]